MSNQDAVRENVQKGYGEIAREGSCCGSTGGCCGGSDPGKVAGSLGYTEAELAVLPEGANMGLSCGNPTAIAELRDGEVVVDLGSGGGFDVFVAARKLEGTGRVIGVDMTPDMISKARRNITSFREATEYDNVEFRLGEIENLPVADRTADVIISNCVINLSPYKGRVWQEMYRVLKPGGRVAVSDLALRKPLPSSLVNSVEALIGCVAGAILISETEEMVRHAGFQSVELETKSDYIEGMTEWNDPLYRDIIRQLPEGSNLGDYVTSLYIKATRP